MQDRQDLDLERGLPLPEGHPSPVAFETALQELQTELREFISDHVSKFLSLHATLPPPNPSHVHPTITAATISGGSPDHPPPCTQIPRTSEDHTKHLRDFLRSHMRCIRVLQAALSSQQLGRPNLVTDPSRTNGGSPINRFQCLGEQFNMQVVVSTFTASLIISWVSFVRSMVLPSHQTAFHIGMFISFIALGLHFGNIVVAGRGAAIAAQHAADPKDSDDCAKYDPKYFRQYLELSEQLQFLATITLIVAVVTMTFYTFSSIVYPTILIGLYALSVVIIFWSAYWKVSMTLRNLKLMIKGLRYLGTRAKSILKNMSP